MLTVKRQSDRDQSRTYRSDRVLGGETPDFKAAEAFDRLQKRASELPIGAAFLFDTIIVDEGQDISDVWRDFIFCHARAEPIFCALKTRCRTSMVGRQPPCLVL